MRTATVLVLTLLVVASVSAQQPHEATPVDQLLAQYWAAHPAVHDHSDHPMIMAEMDPLPKMPDGFIATAARSFSITARQFSFSISPSPFVVNQGDSVTLDVTSADVTHGFFLEQYFDAGTTMNKGQHRTITFVANVPGTFTYACTVPSCGTGHPNMVGELTVQAAPSPPSVSSFTPGSGPTTGGTVVGINGSNFQNGATVKFGDTAAVSVTFNSSSSLSALSPAHAAGDVTIVVTNPDGQSANVGTFSYNIPGPSITSITPPTGSTSGGTAITILGSTFANGAGVTIGGVAATNINVVDSGTINATTPLGPVNISSSSSVDVVVTNPDGRFATSTGGFTYTLPPPSVTSVSPSAGSLNGGTTVIIGGGGFTTALQVTVTFGGIAGTNVHVMSPVALTVVAPAHAVGAVDVVVTVGSTRATSASAFSFAAEGKKRRSVKLK